MEHQNLITGNDDVDLKIFDMLDDVTNLEVNKYSRKIFCDNNFWRNRLFNKFKLKSNDDINYKFATKYLGNGSINRSYQSALNKVIPNSIMLPNMSDEMDNNITSVFKLLLDVVAFDPPKEPLDIYGLNFININLFKHKSYSEFIKEIHDFFEDKKDYFLISSREWMRMSNQSTKTFWNKIIYVGHINIDVTFNDTHNSTLSIEEDFLTKGKLLYELIKITPCNSNRNILKIRYDGYSSHNIHFYNINY